MSKVTVFPQFSRPSVMMNGPDMGGGMRKLNIGGDTNEQGSTTMKQPDEVAASIKSNVTKALFCISGGNFFDLFW
ncbi:MAG: hypothetical protein FD137_1777 [Spirochaetes bacterium]|nr:MAG: hypothetical protein FD137_1777 [Spirochaetota bacterium]